MTDVYSTPFRVMAERIDKNDPAEFSGAVVIVPPTGDPVVRLCLDPSADVAMFWGEIMTKAQMALADLEAAARSQNGGYGRR